MRKWLIAVIALFVLSSCGQSPKGIVEKYITSLDKGEITEAYNLIAKQVILQVGERKIRFMLREQAKSMQEKGGLDELEIEGEAKGEIGHYTMHMTFKDESTMDGEVNVLKEEGEWKISPK
jgi:uncharacterized lipoprotein YehR (DUF1307 family)